MLAQKAEGGQGGEGQNHQGRTRKSGKIFNWNKTEIKKIRHQARTSLFQINLPAAGTESVLKFDKQIIFDSCREGETPWSNLLAP